jgi:cyclase
MLAYRVLARLDIKGKNLIKGVQFEGLRVLGNPAQFAKKYADEGADELLYLDTVASLYGRNQLESLIQDTAGSCFTPILVGGGIGKAQSVRNLLQSGADRVAINTACIRHPELIGDIAARFGSQALAVSIEAKRVNGGWEAYTDCGRNPSNRDAIGWANRACSLGAGEILLTSIDRDGTRKGPDIELLQKMQGLDVPVVYSGGIRLKDVAEVAEYSDGMAIGASLHYGDCTIAQVKDELRKAGKEVR